MTGLGTLTTIWVTLPHNEIPRCMGTCQMQDLPPHVREVWIGLVPRAKAKVNLVLGVASKNVCSSLHRLSDEAKVGRAAQGGQAT